MTIACFENLQKSICKSFYKYTIFTKHAKAAFGGKQNTAWQNIY